MFGLFERKTKWIPLASYNSLGTDYLLMARKGIKSGMIYFRTKRATPIGITSHNLDSSLVDLKTQFEKLLST